MRATPKGVYLGRNAKFIAAAADATGLQICSVRHKIQAEDVLQKGLPSSNANLTA